MECTQNPRDTGSHVPLPSFPSVFLMPALCLGVRAHRNVLVSAVTYGSQQLGPVEKPTLQAALILAFQPF